MLAAIRPSEQPVPCISLFQDVSARAWSAATRQAIFLGDLDRTSIAPNRTSGFTDTRHWIKLSPGLVISSGVLGVSDTLASSGLIHFRIAHTGLGQMNMRRAQVFSYVVTSTEFTTFISIWSIQPKPNSELPNATDRLEIFHILDSWIICFESNSIH